jgi:signal peptidase I
MQDQPAQLVELAASLIRSTGRLRLGVQGSSMLPAIRPRDVLFVRACPAERARVGDIVVFVREGRLFSHRVVARQGTRLVTRGDAVPTADAPVQAHELLGRVKRVVRGSRVLRPARRPSLASGLFLRSPWSSRIFQRVSAWTR